MVALVFTIAGFLNQQGVTLLTSFAVGEVAVGTLSTIYSVDIYSVESDMEDTKTIKERMLKETMMVVNCLYIT